MVHIERVEVYGFKSFGFKNTVVKLAPGLVSISGPNGSGKSNILDAIRFALGEKNAKVMRADTLKDLVHDIRGSGGTKIARASVHLDNRDRTIPVDSDRVEVTRVIDAGGESEYYVNKRKTTRGHLVDTLEAVNAGLNQLNHVQQGTITRISEFGAEEKRRAIEDLIGLSYFDEKKEQATKQLDQADRKLDVALAQMGEVRNRILELEGERNQMIRQRLLESALRRYTAMESLQRLARERSRAKSLEDRLGRASGDLDRQDARLRDMREGIAGVESEKQKYAAGADTHQKERADMELGISRAARAHRAAQDTLRQSLRRVVQIDQRISGIRSEIYDIVESRRQARSKTDHTRSAAREAGNSLDHISAALAAIDERRDRILDEQARAAAENSRIQDKLRPLRADLDRCQRRLAELDMSIDRETREGASDRVKLEGLGKRLAEMEPLRRRLESWIRRREESAESARLEAERLEAERRRLVGDLAGLDPLVAEAGKAVARYDSKLRLVKRVMHEDYSIGRLRTEAPDLGVLGLAYELLSWPPEYERAVMAAGADWLKALVVEDVGTMAAISEAARSMNLPRIRMIPLDSMRDAIPQDVPDALARRVSCDDTAEPLRRFVFGGVALAESAESARRNAARGIRSVTVDGECFWPGGTSVLDRGSRVSNLTQMISVSSHVGGLQKSITLLERARRRRTAKLAGITARLSILAGDRSDMRVQTASAKQNLSELDSRMSSARRVSGEISGRMESRRSRLPGMIKERDTLRGRAAGMRADIAAAESSARSDQRMDDRLSSINRHKADFEKLQTEANSRLSRSRAELSETESSGRRLVMQASALAREQASLVRERRELVSGQDALREDVDSKGRHLEGLHDREQRIIQESGSWVSRTRECDARLDRLRSDERRLAEEVHELQRRCDALRSDLDSSRLESSRISDSLPANPPPSPPDGMDVAPAISAIRAELESLPALNATAPAAYSSVSQGYRSMSNRKNSLELERNRIVAFIEDVERDKRQTYLNAFDTVDKEIRTIFGRMSGGNAWLELENEDDVFGSGIRYMVQFPGKPKRTSVSISGGEKTLAATVFVLALQKLNPSPFYLFDEVDAHLDAPNSERLANILGERAKNSQFIMVSLKEFVVQKAGLIYGVYPKNGVSQVVSYRDSRTRPVAV